MKINDDQSCAAVTLSIRWQCLLQKRGPEFVKYDKVHVLPSEIPHKVKNNH